MDAETTHIIADLENQVGCAQHAASEIIFCLEAALKAAQRVQRSNPSTLDSVIIERLEVALDYARKI